MVENYNEVLYDNETMVTKNLVLRKFLKEDAADVFEFGSDAETLEFLVWEGLKSVEEARAAIINYYWSRPGFFAIELQADQKCIGCIDLRIKAEHDKASFGYVLNRLYWGNGYMTESLSALLALCFEKLELNRVESTHYAGNEGSGRVMVKCGMEFEGVEKHKEKIKGIFRDVVQYGIIKERWHTIRPLHIF